MPGSPIDLPHIDDTGSAGIGLFRTELQFMVGQSLPRTSDQLALYRAVLDAAGPKPVTFRTLDIGGDKALPYMETVIEENPALGWRATRLDLAQEIAAGSAASPRRCALRTAVAM